MDLLQHPVLACLEVDCTDQLGLVLAVLHMGLWATGYQHLSLAEQKVPSGAHLGIPAVLLVQGTDPVSLSGVECPGSVHTDHPRKCNKHKYHNDN